MKVFSQRNFDMLKKLWQPQLLFFFNPSGKLISCQPMPDSEGGSVANTGYSKNKLEIIVLYTLKNHTDWEQCSFSDTKVLSF